MSKKPIQCVSVAASAIVQAVEQGTWIGASPALYLKPVRRLRGSQYRRAFSLAQLRWEDKYGADAPSLTRESELNFQLAGAL
jgi:hypothetical protein